MDRRYNFTLLILVPLSMIQSLSSDCFDFEASIHGCIHLLASIIPVYVEIPKGSLSCDCHGGNSQRILIYTQIALQALWENISELMIEIIFRSFQVLSACECENGCLGCIIWEKCLYLKPIMCKKGSLSLLKALLSKTF